MIKLVMLLFITTALFAHPHTFIDIYPDIKVKDGVIEKLQLTWKIDEMTSSMLLMDVDTNGDGKFDAKEEKHIEYNYFNIMADYDFYTFIKVDKKSVKMPKITHFHAFVENNKVCYRFEMELHTQAKQTSLEFGDSDFYVAMMLKNKFVTIEGAKAKVTGVDNDFYYGYRLEFK